MSIYEKIDDIQNELLTEDFQESSGFHGKYIKLPELILKIKPVCRKHNILFYFTVSDSHLILKVIDRDTGEQLSPAPHVRLPGLKDMKTEGGNYTYMKRYLLMNLFLVIAESADPDDFADEKSYAENVTNTGNSNDYDPASSAPTNNTGIDGVIEKTVELLQAKGLHEDEITPRAIYNTVNSNKELPQSVKTNMLDWYKGFTKEEKTTRYVGASA